MCDTYWERGLAEGQIAIVLSCGWFLGELNHLLLNEFLFECKLLKVYLPVKSAMPFLFPLFPHFFLVLNELTMVLEYDLG